MRATTHLVTLTVKLTVTVPVTTLILATTHLVTVTDTTLIDAVLIAMSR
jgi:hypothetical protein